MLRVMDQIMNQLRIVRTVELPKKKESELTDDEWKQVTKSVGGLRWVARTQPLFAYDIFRVSSWWYPSSASSLVKKSLPLRF